MNSGQISNFSSMEQDEYIARAMFRTDLKEQLRYAKDKGIAIGEARGREELFALLRQGYLPKNYWLPKRGKLRISISTDLVEIL